MALREQLAARSVPQRALKFQRPKVWQGFLLTLEEKQRIDNLMCSALMDEALCYRLVHERDISLMASFGCA